MSTVIDFQDCLAGSMPDDEGSQRVSADRGVFGKTIQDPKTLLFVRLLRLIHLLKISLRK